MACDRSQPGHAGCDGTVWRMTGPFAKPGQTYTCRERANRAADRLDLRYGAARHGPVRSF